MLDGGCMLCEMRDLAHCAVVNKQWNHAGYNVLYGRQQRSEPHRPEGLRDPRADIIMCA